MRPISQILLFAAAAQSASLQERAFIAPRPVSVPKVASIPESPYRPNSLHPAGSRPAGIGSDPKPVAGVAPVANQGTAPESTTPFQPGFYKRNKELIEKAIESVGEVFNLLSDIADLAGGGDDDDDDNGDDNKWRTPSSTIPRPIKPTQVASTSDGATNTTANFLVSQNNVTYTFLSDPRLLSKDVVDEMVGPSFNRLKLYKDLFTGKEYSMFLKDPICFYANIENMYLNASKSAEAAASITPSPAQSPQRRQSPDDEAGENTSCVDVGIAGIDPVCTAVPGSPEWTSSQASEISSLWAYELPDQLFSAHFATPTAISGDVTATATSTTSCAGLDGGDGPKTRYRELKLRGMDAEATSGTTNDGGSSTTPVSESVSTGVKLDGGLVFACLAGGIAVLGGVML